jgi:rfaE bifunctional protein kinase chain/domain
MRKNKIEETLDRMAGRRVLVAGDVMLDHFVRGEVNRISPEAPVPVVRVTSESDMPGAAANVAMNLASLGAVPVMVGAIGDDADGAHLKDLLTKAGVDCSGLIVDPNIHTTRKVRIIARSQHVVRVDWDGVIKDGDNVHEKLYHTAKELSSTCEVLILQDYNKGLCDQALNEALASSGKTLLVDPNRYCATPYSGTFATPNLEEALILSGYTPKTSALEELDRVAEAFFRRHNVESLVITLSEHGIALCERSGAVMRAKAATLRGVFDVSGAGDTVVAVLGAALAAGASPWDACQLANVAGGIVVGKSGTASTTIEELRQNLPNMEN